MNIEQDHHYAQNHQHCIFMVSPSIAQCGAIFRNVKDAKCVFSVQCSVDSVCSAVQIYLQIYSQSVASVFTAVCTQCSGDIFAIVQLEMEQPQ